MKRLVQHLWVIPGIVLLLAGLNFAADPYLMKSGDTTPEIDVEMWKSADGTTCAVIIDPNDVTVYYTEEGEAQESYSDAVECTSEAAAWVAKSCISRPSKNSMRICLPTDAVDGGIGKYVKIWVTTGTYEGSATIHLGAPVNAYLSDGSTPPTLADLEDADYSDATFPDMTLADDSITNAKIADSAVLEIADRSAGLWLSDPNLAEYVAQNVVTIVNAGTKETPAAAVMSGGTGTVQGWTQSGVNITSIKLESGASATDDFYNGAFLSITYNGRTAITKITDYNGTTKYALIMPYLSTSYVTGTSTYEINGESTPSEDAGFGPNAANAVIEKAGIAAGVSLSTTTTFYITDGYDLDDIFKENTIVICKDPNGIYRYGVVDYANNTTDTIVLKGTGVDVAPADGTMIYPYGYDLSKYIWKYTTELVPPWTMLEALYNNNSVDKWYVSTDTPGLGVGVGSTANTIVFESSAFFGDSNPIYCPIMIYDSSGADTFVAICTGYDKTTYKMNIFPSLPFTPETGDIVSFKWQFGGLIPIPPSGSYDWLVSTEDVARVSTQTTLYYSGSDNAFIQPGAVLAVKNSAGFYEKPVVGSVNTGTDTITFSTGMIAPPADGESVYLVETSKYGVWLKSIIRSVLNSL